jgi:signal transduction histidine kinase
LPERATNIADEAHSPPELARILSVYEHALSLDFALQEEAGESRIMPHGVIVTLCELLRADGGNFTIYHADEDYLEVRARYNMPSNEALEFANFKEKLREIGRDPKLRSQSSSYRCFDRQSTILIESSSTQDVERMTLDVGALNLKDNLSAIAVPFKHHGQIIGVLNLDMDNAKQKHFSSDDRKMLEQLAVLLPPILHNSLTIETITKINDVILNKRRDDSDKVVLGAVCKAISDYLFVPSVTIFLRHEALPHKLVLCGHNGRQLPQESLNQLQLFDAKSLGLPAQNVLATQKMNVTSTLMDCFPFLSRTGGLAECRIFNLRDKSRLVDGLLVLAGGKPNSSHSFQRLCSFVADFTSLTLGALKQFDFRTREAYETAAHELSRNLRQLRNTQYRLQRIQRSIDSHYRLERIPDETILHQLSTVTNANAGHLNTVEQTLRSLVAAPRQDSKTAAGYDEYSSPILHGAKRRQDAFSRQAKKTTIDLKYEINDICNSFTRAMGKKQVKWDQSKLGFLPKLIELERHNFHTVFENLVDNAVKYSKPNTAIKLVSDVEELQVVLTIINIGPPIDIHGPESSDIFLPRYRGLVASAMTRGLGLGLWQARLVARLWGGDPLRIVFSEPLPALSGDTHRWASNGFQIEIPILNPDHISLS